MSRQSYACFECRISLKREQGDRIARCPRCRGVLHRMGHSFSAPKQRKEKEWRKVQILYAEGFRFDGCGRGEPPLAKLPHDVEDFISQNPNHWLKTAERRPELLP